MGEETRSRALRLGFRGGERGPYVLGSETSARCRGIGDEAVV